MTKGSPVKISCGLFFALALTAFQLVILPNMALARTVVSLTFDDGDSDALLATQILDPYGLKATFYVNSGRIGKAGFLALSDLMAMKSGGHEIAGHTIDHVDLATLTPAQQQYQICNDRTAFINAGFNVISFAYPFGSYNSSAIAAVQSCGYVSARSVGGLTCSGCAPAENIPPARPFEIQTPTSIKSYTSLAQIEQYVMSAEQSGGGWVPLVLHHVCDQCNTYSISPAILTGLASWLRDRSSQGTVVQTVGQVMGGTPATNPPPGISALSPTTTTPGGPSFTLTVYGSNFITSSSVLWNGTARPTTYLGSTQLSAAISSSDIASPGTANVSVFNPGPGGGTSSGLAFPVGAPTGSAAYTIWPNSTDPGPNAGWKDPSPVELGLRFRSDVAGSVTSVRFFKQTFNTGTHIGSLWTDNGTLLGQATFTSESNFGWQTVTFPSPIAIQANTVYVASYHSTAGYASTPGFFATNGVDAPPLHALANTVEANGLYLYGSSPAFPQKTQNSTNYWVDVVFVTGGGTSSNPVPSLTSISPNSTTVGGTAFTLTVSGSNFINGSIILWNGANRATSFLNTSTLSTVIPASDISSAGTATVSVFNPSPGGGNSAGQTFTISSSPTNPIPSLTSISPNSATAGNPGFTLTATGANFIPSSFVTWNGTSRPTTFVNSGTLQAAISGSDVASAGSATLAVTNPAPGGGNSANQNFVISPPSSTGCTSCTIWPNSTDPGPNAGWKDPSPLEMGLRFRSDVAGSISGIRFFKQTFNTGTHIGSLWSDAGGLLGQATFTGESASGWQTVVFPSPVAIQANVVYVASYHSTSGYASSPDYFAANGVDAAPLHALANSVETNGLFLYGPSPVFPRQTTRSTNYWVDVVFSPSGAVVSHSLPRGQLGGGTTFPTGSFVDLSQARVHPNPWRADLHAGKKIVFDQLSPNSTVDIFTVSAHWIKKLDASSGATAWDLTTDGGDPVASGYYIYLIRDDQSNRKRGVLGVAR